MSDGVRAERGGRGQAYASESYEPHGDCEKVAEVKDDSNRKSLSLGLSSMPSSTPRGLLKDAFCGGSDFGRTSHDDVFPNFLLYKWRGMQRVVCWKS